MTERYAHNDQKQLKTSGHQSAERINFGETRQKGTSHRIYKIPWAGDPRDLLGHSDLKLTERYSHIGENQLKQAVLKLQNS